MRPRHEAADDRAKPGVDVCVLHASMRPRHEAADDIVSLMSLPKDFLASMRPRHEAADDVPQVEFIYETFVLQGGRGTKPRMTPKGINIGMTPHSFNEAAARSRGGRNTAAAGHASASASMRPRHEAADDPVIGYRNSRSAAASMRPRHEAADDSGRALGSAQGSQLQGGRGTKPRMTWRDIFTKLQMVELQGGRGTKPRMTNRGYRVAALRGGFNEAAARSRGGRP